QMANQPDEAAAIYGRLLDERYMSRRDEDLLQRRVTALHLAGYYEESDKAAAEFEKRYPKRLWLPEVLFRRAESAARRSSSTALDGAAEHYRRVADQYPEFVHAQRARLGLARMHYRKGELDAARENLEKIPRAEHSGDLAVVPYLLADCLIRLAPARADDALA